MILSSVDDRQVEVNEEVRSLNITVFILQAKRFEIRITVL